jgi:hypothetical protein
LRLAGSCRALDAVWAGACCGAAASTKYLGLLVGAVAGAAVLAVAARARSLRLAGAALGPGIALALPWYVRNLVVTGNPVYPLFFGGERLTAAGEGAIDAVRHAYGTDGPLPRLLALPFDLIADGDAFDRGRYVGHAILLLALVALALRPRRAALALWLGALAYLVVWWIGSPQARFLLPPLAVLAAPAGVVLARALAGPRRLRLGAAAAVAVSALAWAAAAAALTRQLLPSAFGAESRAEAAERLTGTYDELHAVARRADGTLALAGYLFAFHYPEEAIQLGLPEFAPDVPPRTALRRLRAYSVSDVLVAGTAPRLEGCLRRVARYDARFVTSRSLGESTPLALVLYRVRERCR